MSVTAATIVRALERQRFQSDLSVLSDLDATHSEAVRAALKGIPSKAKIDLRLLVSAVRSDIAERVAARSATSRDGLSILKYQLSCMSKDELVAMRDQLRARVDAGEGEQPFELGSPGSATINTLAPVRSRLPLCDVEPDDETGGDEPEARPMRRRSIQRIRYRRSMEQSEGDPASPTPPTQKTRPEQRALPAFMPQSASARPWGCPVGVDYESWKNPQMPAWLISEEDYDEKDMQR